VFETPTILVAELDLDRLRGERMNLDVTGHYHRPDAFEFRVVRTRRSSSIPDR
jgi:hypothetical protein